MCVKQRPRVWGLENKEGEGQATWSAVQRLRLRGAGSPMGTDNGNEGRRKQQQGMDRCVCV